MIRVPKEVIIFLYKRVIIAIGKGLLKALGKIFRKS